MHVLHVLFYVWTLIGDVSQTSDLLGQFGVWIDLGLVYVLIYHLIFFKQKCNAKFHKLIRQII